MSYAYEGMFKTLYDAVAKGDMETVLALLTDDIEFHVFGRSRVAGSYLGKDQIVDGTTITIDLTGDRAMVPAKQFRDATSRIFPVQLTGDRLPFFGAQRRTPTHQAIPQNIPRKGGHLSRSKSATIRTCRYDHLSPR